jgi:hypothetical protein
MPPIFKILWDALPGAALRLTEFGVTFWLIRYAGSRIRMALRSRVSRHSNRMLLSVLHVLPTLAVGIIVLTFERLGIAALSSRAVVFSIVVDGLNLFGACIWWGVIVAVGRRWIGIRAPLVCVENRSNAAVDLVSVSLLRVISGKRLEVPVREFARYFKQDYRRVVEIHLRDPKAVAILGLSAREMREMPHWGLGVEVPQNPEHSLNTRVPRRPKSPPSDVGLVSFLSEFALGELPQSRVSWLAGQQNKLLYDQLPDPLWKASCAICRNTPRLIATQWQMFHLHTSLSFRFITLLNTMDLLQRLVGSTILVTLRAAQGLPESIVKDSKFLSRWSFGEWNKIIETALESEHLTESTQVVNKT